MRKIEIRGSEESPKFILNPLRGSIKILGRSTMAFPEDFYLSIIKSLREYAEKPAERTHLFIDLENYNEVSSKYLLVILRIISGINEQPNKHAKIIWYFEEEDYGVKDDIKSFSNLIQHKIHAIQYEMA